MGAWGTAIKSNDTYADVYGDFFDRYNNGEGVSDISKRLKVRHLDTINDPEDCNNFWFALAKAQWDCKQIDALVLDKVKQIIETGSDIEIWRRLGADEKSVKKRKIALEAFLHVLLSERPKAKARKKKIFREPVFEKGDCLVFILENGNYGGALELEALHGSETPYVLIAITKLNQATKPTKQEFISAEVLILNFASHGNRPDIFWMLPGKKHTSSLIEKVDNLEVSKEYISKKYEFGFSGPFDIRHISRIDGQFRHELESGTRPTKIIKIKELI